MFKNLVIAILIALLITYCIEEVLFDWFDIHIAMGDQPLEGLATFALFAAGAVILVILGFFLAMSLIGVMLFVACVVILSILAAGIASLWPVILMMGVLIWLIRDDRKVS